MNGDEYGVVNELHALAFAHDRIQKTSNNCANEHNQRRGVDDIIEIAFSTRTDRHCDFKYVCTFSSSLSLSVLALEPNNIITSWK
jgi:hypothetical protein